VLEPKLVGVPESVETRDLVALPVDALDGRTVALLSGLTVRPGAVVPAADTEVEAVEDFDRPGDAVTEGDVDDDGLDEGQCEGRADAVNSADAVAGLLALTVVDPPSVLDRNAVLDSLAVVSTLDDEFAEEVVNVVERGDADMETEGAVDAVASVAVGETESAPVVETVADAVPQRDERADMDDDALALLDGVDDRDARGEKDARVDGEVDLLNDGVPEALDDDFPDCEARIDAVATAVEDAAVEELGELDGAAEMVPELVLESTPVAVVNAVRDAESAALSLAKDAVVAALEDADVVGDELPVCSADADETPVETALDVKGPDAVLLFVADGEPLSCAVCDCVCELDDDAEDVTRALLKASAVLDGAEAVGSADMLAADDSAAETVGSGEIVGAAEAVSGSEDRALTDSVSDSTAVAVAS
jgi:hypothetical protein